MDNYYEKSAKSVHMIGILSIVFASILSICSFDGYKILARCCSLFNGICISIFAAYIFYLFQSYFFELKTKKVIYPNILKRIELIIQGIDGAVLELEKLYIQNHNGLDYSPEELHKMLNLNFDDETTIVDSISWSNGEKKHISLRYWLINCDKRVENEIDRLYLHYGIYIPPELSDVLEEIMHCSYHTILIDLAKKDIKTESLSKCNTEYIADYWNLRNNLNKYKVSLMNN